MLYMLGLTHVKIKISMKAYEMSYIISLPFSLKVDQSIPIFKQVTIQN